MRATFGPTALRAIRAAVVGLSGALVLASLAAFATSIYGRDCPQRMFDYHPELYGFATGFLTGSMVAGASAMAIYGTKSRALALIAVLTGLLAAGSCNAWARLVLVTRGSQPWLSNEWHETASGIKTGLALGAPVGLIVAACLALIATLSRRRLSWRLGLAVAGMIFAAGTWAIPWFVWHVTDMAQRGYWNEHGLGEIATVRGSAVGSATGSLVGAVVCVLIGRKPSPRTPERMETSS